MKLLDLLERTSGAERSLAVVTREQPAAVADQLPRTFAGQPVAVEERSLTGRDVDVHVYGVPDRVPDLAVAVHAGEGDDYRRSWFVVFEPDAVGEPTALLAWETEPRRWRGIWTYRPALVAEIDAAIARELD